MLESDLKEIKENFSFTEENLAKSKEIIVKYPVRFSAVMPLLDLAQRQNGGFLTTEILMYVAQMLAMPYIKVYEVATFYTMYNLREVGKYLVQVCRTTPCWLCKSDDVLQAIKQELQIEIGQTTKDKLFTLKEVECLGACINAPIVQINDDYYEKVTPEKIMKILQKLREKNN